MSVRKSSRLLIGLVGAATAAALVMPGAAFAKGPGGGGGGGGRPGEDPAARFNLSVPAIFVDDDPFGLTCGDATEPTGTPSRATRSATATTSFRGRTLGRRSASKGSRRQRRWPNGATIWQVTPS